MINELNKYNIIYHLYHRYTSRYLHENQFLCLKSATLHKQIQKKKNVFFWFLRSQPFSRRGGLSDCPICTAACDGLHRRWWFFSAWDGERSEAKCEGIGRMVKKGLVRGRMVRENATVKSVQVGQGVQFGRIDTSPPKVGDKYQQGIYDGRKLVDKQNVVLVNVNYRPGELKALFSKESPDHEAWSLGLPTPSIPAGWGQFSRLEEQMLLPQTCIQSQAPKDEPLQTTVIFQPIQTYVNQVIIRCISNSHLKNPRTTLDNILETLKHLRNNSEKNL